MFTFEHLQGLPYAALGDTVEIVISNGLVSLTHYGIQDTERQYRGHKGQQHSWNLRLDATDIKGVHIKALPKAGGLFGRLFGFGSKKGSDLPTVYLELEAHIGEARIAGVLKGDYQAAYRLKKRLLDARSNAIPAV